MGELPRTRADGTLGVLEGFPYRVASALMADESHVVRVGLALMAVGLAVWRLGAGRAAPGERVQAGAGLRIHRRPGEPVTAGEALFTLYTETPHRFGPALAELDGAWSVGDTSPDRRPLIIDRIGT